MKSRRREEKENPLFMQELELMLDQRVGLYKLSNTIPWKVFEKSFEKYYSEDGRPAKPIRLMVGLLMLKYLENLSDERVVEVWSQNPYYQYFCGERYFQWGLPCDPSDLVYFRNRIGEDGVKKIFEVSINLHRKDVEQEVEVVADTTVQEKNITYPTDVKLRLKVIERCWKISEKETVVFEHSYRRKVPELLSLLRTRSNRTSKRRNKARLKLRTYAGRLLREIERKLSKEKYAAYEEEIVRMQKILSQRREDKNKCYSLHEPEVSCIAKGKAHKPYEFGSKASIVMTAKSGVIVGARSFKGNPYDGDTLVEALTQVESLIGKRPESCLVDRGYRGRVDVGGTKIELPKKAKQSESYYHRKKHRKRFARRSAIEPLIGHMKQDHRMARNYLKGSVGDQLNVLLSASGFNLKKWLNRVLLWLKIVRPDIDVLSVLFAQRPIYANLRI
jgi:transposase, IS5 family